MQLNDKRTLKTSQKRSGAAGHRFCNPLLLDKTTFQRTEKPLWAPLWVLTKKMSLTLEYANAFEH